jgi:hypothetical protein
MEFPGFIFKDNTDKILIYAAYTLSMAFNDTGKSLRKASWNNSERSQS